MLQKYKSKREEGFTIIEVLIVLAIAGLIILIVFLAVPALQRNSRNTQRKNDVTALLGAMQEYVNNNGGNLPPAADHQAVVNSGKLAFYSMLLTDNEVTVDTDNTTATATITPAQGQVQIVNFAKCPATIPASPAAVPVATGATRRGTVAIYQVETSGGFATQCQDM